MNILDIETIIEPIQYITTDEYIFGYYRRYQSGSWERLMGESWEPVYYDTELEKVYTHYKIKKESEIFEEDDLFIENEEFWTQRIIDEEYKKQNEKE